MVCAGGGARQAGKRSVRHLNSSASGNVRVSALFYWVVVVVVVPVGARGAGLSFAASHFDGAAMAVTTSSRYFFIVCTAVMMAVRSSSR
jgi:hypothetical protein